MGAARYWTRFDFPFWWNNLVAALDSLARIDYSSREPRIAEALDWLVAHQASDGLWNCEYGRPGAGNSRKAAQLRPWISLAVCRVMKRLHEAPTRGAASLSE